MSTPQTVARFLASALPDYGVSHVFELIGGMITHLIDSMHETRAQIRLVSVHHEQGGGVRRRRASARMTGVPGVAMATSGPGATNLLTGIGSCYFDSAPAVFITGQVNRHEQKGDRRDPPARVPGDRHRRDGRADHQVGRRVTTTRGASPECLRRGVPPRALRAGPGPVLLDMPMDVQRRRHRRAAGRVAVAAGAAPPDSERAGFVERARHDARRGASARSSWPAAASARRGAVDAFRAFVERLGVPVVNSLMGVDVAAATSTRCGVGHDRQLRQPLGEPRRSRRSDLLLVLGSRLDVRQTGRRPRRSATGAQILHVDCEPGEINNRVTGCRRPVRRPRGLPAARGRTRRPLPRRRLGLARRDRRESGRSGRTPRRSRGIAGINPNVAHARSSSTGVGRRRPRTSPTSASTRCGRRSRWSCGPDQRFLTSGGMGAMGFALPAAIGAALAGPGRPGRHDRRRRRLPAQHPGAADDRPRTGCRSRSSSSTTSRHGMVRQFQQSYFDGAVPVDALGLLGARLHRRRRGRTGSPAWHVSTHDELLVALKEIDAAGSGPSVLHVDISDTLNAYPKMAFGRPFGSMEPDVAPTEMEGT